MYKGYVVVEVYTSDVEHSYEVPIRYFTSEASAAKFAKAVSLDSEPEVEYVVRRLSL